jgi:predicted methyltransferase
MRHATITCIIVLLLAPPVLAAEQPAPDPALQKALADPQRSPKFVARDAIRHPGEELAFFGLRPDATVVEIEPGAGYWTEILAPYLMAHGTYYVAVPSGPDEAKGTAKYRAKLAADPARYGKITVTEIGAGHDTIAPPGTADFVLTFRNLHNWMGAGIADEVLHDFYVALKPGGTFGIEEHRGSEKIPQDPKANSGYVRQDYAIALAKKAGFVLVASSELLANPKDTKDYPEGVWTLPPTFQLGAKDHDKYAAIGEADNFLLKFRKPAE